VDVEDAVAPLEVDVVAVADKLGENEAVELVEPVAPPVSEELPEEDRLGSRTWSTTC
jgi:hypothetical protein